MAFRSAFKCKRSRVAFRSAFKCRRLRVAFRSAFKCRRLGVAFKSAFKRVMYQQVLNHPQLMLTICPVSGTQDPFR